MRALVLFVVATVAELVAVSPDVLLSAVRSGQTWVDVAIEAQANETEQLVVESHETFDTRLHSLLARVDVAMAARFTMSVVSFALFLYILSICRAARKRVAVQVSDPLPIDLRLQRKLLQSLNHQQ